MKKKIGLVDLFIDEWHSNHLPEWIAKAARKDEFELYCAWEEAPFPGRKNLSEWCAAHGLIAAKSIEEVVEKCDAVSVLAPANPEVHARLAEIPLRSGKPVYVDKPFADSLAAAEKMFEIAEKHSTPLMTSSALRFSDGLFSGEVRKMDPFVFCTAGGGRSFPEYAIHQLEMIVSVMGTEVQGMELTGNAEKLFLNLQYSGSRLATAVYAPALPFEFHAICPDGRTLHHAASGYWEQFTDSLLDFFATGISPIPHEQTLCIAGLLEKSVALLNNQ